MKKTRKFFLVVFYSFLVFQLHPQDLRAQSYSLENAFHAAKLRSDDIKDQDEQIKQAEEHYRQAIGAVLPNIVGSATYTKQQKITSLSASTSPSFQPLVKISLTQPLFSGLKEYAALSQMDLLEQDAKIAKSLALKVLFLDLLQTYMNVLSYESDIKNYLNDQVTYEKRIKLLREWIRIGRSKESDVLTVVTSLATLKAQIFQTEGVLNATREMLAFTTGLPSDIVLEDPIVEALASEDLSALVKQSQDRDELKSTALKISAAEEGVKIARGDHFPTVNFLGNYYLRRPGDLEQAKWDVGIGIAVPLFSGGIITSHVTEALSQKSRAEIAQEKMKKQIDEDVKSSYQTLLGDRNQVKALEEAKTAADKNLKSLEADYVAGLVTNQDVLLAISALAETNRTLEHTKYSVTQDLLKLQVSASAGPHFLFESAKY